MRFKVLSLGSAVAALSLVVSVFAGNPEKPAPAKPAGQQKLDGIAAVVGDEIILKSDLDAYAAMRMASANIKLSDSAAIKDYKRKCLEDMIDGKVLVAHAKNDTTISLADEEVDRAVENQITAIMKQNNLTIDGLEAALMREQGISLAKFKSEMRPNMREQMLKARVQRQYLPTIRATRRDVEEFYAKYRDSLPKAGESALLSRLAISVSAAPAVRQTAWDKIVSIKKHLDKGERFEDVAKKYSEGPEAASGGDLGFIEKGSLNLLAFERKAFSMAPGQTSDAFETRLGFHIIKVDEKQNQQVHVRQIFVKVAPSASETKRVTDLLDSISRNCTSTDAFKDAVKKYSTDDATKMHNGSMGWKTLQVISGPLRAAIDTLSPGSLTPVLQEENECAIYRVDDRVKERALTLDDDWPVLADKASDIMTQKKLLELVARWRKQIYVSIRM